jgi:hypothetical protein
MAKQNLMPKPMEPRPREVAGTRTWFEAYKLFLMNKDERLGLKLLPLVALGILPAALADDILLPFLGLADNVPMAILVMFIAVRTWMRVRLYR